MIIFPCNLHPGFSSPIPGAPKLKARQIMQLAPNHTVHSDSLWAQVQVSYFLENCRSQKPNCFSPLWENTECPGSFTVSLFPSCFGAWVL